MVRLLKLILGVLFENINSEDIMLYYRKMVFIVITFLFKLWKGCESWRYC
jgi:hypothetical protein